MRPFPASSSQAVGRAMGSSRAGSPRAPQPSAAPRPAKPSTEPIVPSGAESPEAAKALKSARNAGLLVERKSSTAARGHRVLPMLRDVEAAGVLGVARLAQVRRCGSGEPARRVPLECGGEGCGRASALMRHRQRCRDLAAEIAADAIRREDIGVPGPDPGLARAVVVRRVAEAEVVVAARRRPGRRRRPGTGAP